VRDVPSKITNKLAKLILVAVISILVLVACGSDSNDVPSLVATPTVAVVAATPTATVVEQVLDEKDIRKAVDQYVALAECLREEGIDIDDPTAATLDSWMGDFKSAINWDDPAQIEIYETCSGGMGRKACWRTNYQYTRSHLAPRLTYAQSMTHSVEIL